MANIKINEIGLIDSLEGEDSALVLDSATRETKRATMSQISAFVGSDADYKIVSNIEERNNIPSSQRTEGMKIKVLSNDKTYELIGGTDNSNWLTILYGIKKSTQGGTLYVNNVTGDDDALGGSSTPLRSIQEAINRLIPPHHTPQWDKGFEPIIYVQHTGTDYTDIVYKPKHKGEGILRIVGEEEVLHSGLVQSGIAAITGYYALNRLSTTTSVMTPGALTGAKVRPQQAINDNYLDELLEYVTIADNDTNTIDIVGAVALGTVGFGYINGMIFDVVKAQINWVAGSSLYTGCPLITNEGGCLVVEGFIFPPINTGYTVLRSIESGTGGGGFAAQSCLNRCDFPTGDWTLNAPLSTGFGIWFTACEFSENIVAAHGGNVTVSTSRGKIAAKSLLSFAAFSHFGSVYLSSVAGSHGSSWAPFASLGANDSFISELDIRDGDQLLLANCSFGRLQAISCENVGAKPCIEIFQSSVMYITSTQGTTGNEDTALKLRQCSNVGGRFGSLIMSGTNGQVRTGSAAVHTWTTVTTDTVQLCRFGAVA